ncbi:unnamed protein product [Caenorhabditis angaria]|uniref:Uncharacterized protein n=1 Tax=Caenorhabditis angaria TaxID=860376 RepID=A0A9P1IES7_9PELO|nr:unnamed protein product [Caenorhabditis angaria]
MMKIWSFAVIIWIFASFATCQIHVSYCDVTCHKTSPAFHVADITACSATPQAADNHHDEESSSNAEEDEDDEARLPGAVFRAAAARPRRRPQAVPRAAANNPPVQRNPNPYVHFLAENPAFSAKI